MASFFLFTLSKWRSFGVLLRETAISLAPAARQSHDKQLPGIEQRSRKGGVIASFGEDVGPLTRGKKNEVLFGGLQKLWKPKALRFFFFLPGQKE